jgi:hypothetical protein
MSHIRGSLLIRCVGHSIPEDHIRSDECCRDCSAPVAGVDMAIGKLLAKFIE